MLARYTSDMKDSTGDVKRVLHQLPPLSEEHTMNMTTITQHINHHAKTAVVGGTVLAAASLFSLTADAQGPKRAVFERADQGGEKTCQADHKDGDRAHRPPRGDMEGRRGHDGPPPREGFGPRGDRDFDGPGDRPERHARRGEDGHRPPQFRGGRGEGPQGGFDGPPRGRRGGEGPGQRPGPPSFEDIDADGNGSISSEEFKAFHDRRPERGPEGNRGPHRLGGPDDYRGPHGPGGPEANRGPRGPEGPGRVPSAPPVE